MSDGSPDDWEEREQALIAERSRLIVDAAYELIEEGGLQGLTIRAMLKKTGLSRRAFYERFGGKDDLMLAVFTLTMKRVADHYAEQVKPLRDPVERLKLIVISMGLATSNPERAAHVPLSRLAAAMSREHLRLAESRPDDLQAALDPLITVIASGLADGMVRGIVRDGDARQMATLVYNLVSATVHTDFVTHDGILPDHERRVQTIDQVWEFCRRAVVA